MANTLKFGNGEWYGKKDTILAYNDENNNYKPLPFDFSRASSATVINKQGLIETVGSGEPRIDYKDDSKGALLLEPSRSNLILTSARGTYGNSPASETNTISPDGTNNAVIPTPDSVSDRYEHSIGSNTYATDTKLVYSWYRKRISTPIHTSILGDLQFNVLVNVTQVGSTTQIQSDVNGFDRFQAVLNITNGSSYTTIRAYFGHIIGIGNSSVAYFGHQLEVGSYATSYIPTQGSAVTRVADVCNQTPPSGIIGQTEGTMFFEIDFKNTSQVAGAWSISSGSSANRITMNTLGFSSTQFTLSIAQNYNSSSTKLASTNVTYIDNHKVAIKYSATTLKLFVDGQLSDSVLTDGFGNYTKFYIGGNQVGVGGDARKFIQADLYNTALTDQELQALTTI